MTPPSTTSYDEVPYADRVHPATHPDLLAVVGTLFGMSPALPDRCRVLELGCAGAPTRLRSAQSLPGLRFVGVDLSPRQVEAGRQKVQALGLNNVESTRDEPRRNRGGIRPVRSHSSATASTRGYRLRSARRHPGGLLLANLMPQGIAYVRSQLLSRLARPRLCAGD